MPKRMPTGSQHDSAPQKRLKGDSMSGRINRFNTPRYRLDITTGEATLTLNREAWPTDGFSTIQSISQPFSSWKKSPQIEIVIHAVVGPDELEGTLEHVQNHVRYALQAQQVMDEPFIQRAAKFISPSNGRATIQGLTSQIMPATTRRDYSDQKRLEVKAPTGPGQADGPSREPPSQARPSRQKDSRPLNSAPQVPGQVHSGPGTALSGGRTGQQISPGLMPPLSQMKDGPAPIPSGEEEKWDDSTAFPINALKHTHVPTKFDQDGKQYVGNNTDDSEEETKRQLAQRHKQRPLSQKKRQILKNLAKQRKWNNKQRANHRKAQEIMKKEIKAGQQEKMQVAMELQTQDDDHQEDIQEQQRRLFPKGPTRSKKRSPPYQLRKWELPDNQPRGQAPHQHQSGHSNPQSDPRLQLSPAEEQQGDAQSQLRHKNEGQPAGQPPNGPNTSKVTMAEHISPHKPTGHSNSQFSTELAKNIDRFKLMKAMDISWETLMQWEKIQEDHDRMSTTTGMKDIELLKEVSRQQRPTFIVETPVRRNKEHKTNPDGFQKPTKSFKKIRKTPQEYLQMIATRQGQESQHSPPGNSAPPPPSTPSAPSAPSAPSTPSATSNPPAQPATPAWFTALEDTPGLPSYKEMKKKYTTDLLIIQEAVRLQQQDQQHKHQQEQPNTNSKTNSKSQNEPEAASAPVPPRPTAKALRLTAQPSTSAAAASEAPSSSSNKADVSKSKSKSKSNGQQDMPPPKKTTAKPKKDKKEKKDPQTKKNKEAEPTRPSIIAKIPLNEVSMKPDSSAKPAKGTKAKAKDTEKAIDEEISKLLSEDEADKA